MKSIKVVIIFFLLITDVLAQSVYINGGIGFGTIDGPMLYTPNVNFTSTAFNFSTLIGVPVYEQKINLEFEYTHISSGFQGGKNAIGEFSMKHSMLIPGVKVYFGQTRYSIYAKLGFVIALKGVVEVDRIFSRFDTIISPPDQEKHDTYYTTAITQGKAAYGITAAIGYNYKLMQHLSVFGEVNYIGISWSPSHSEVVESTGRDLSNFTIEQKQVDYTEYLPSIYKNPAQPSQQSAPSIGFKNVGVGVGLTYYLGRR